MSCLILKLQGPKLEKCRSYCTKRYINYNDTLRPNILVVWEHCAANQKSDIFSEQYQNILVKVKLYHSLTKSALETYNVIFLFNMREKQLFFYDVLQHKNMSVFFNTNDNTF